MLSLQEIARFISDDYYSDKKRKARVGKRYYDGKHDINNYRLFYFDGDGILREDRYRSNIKIPHPFFTEIVNQSVQYIFSGDRIARSENPELQKKLDSYFNRNEEFLSAVSELVAGSMAKGAEYLYLYRNNEGKLSFQCVNSLCVTEVDGKNSEDGKGYIIYCYNDSSEKGKSKFIRIYVGECDFVYFYVQAENGVVKLDENESLNPSPHIIYSDENGEKYCGSFGFIPFFRFDNGSNAQSDLWVIKELIDDYDLMASSLSNNLIDFDMPLYAVTGFDGDSLDELQQNLKTKKIIGLGEDGGVEIKTVDVPYQARQAKLELDEKNIYRFGMGLNTDGLKDSAATTNIAIKAAYSLLDLKCGRIEMKLKSFLSKVIKPVLEEINRECGKKFSVGDLWFEFRHEIMSNAYENAQIEKLMAEENQIKIQTLLGVSELLDDETLLRNICKCLEVNYDEIYEKVNEKSEKKLQIQQNMDKIKTNEKSGTALNGAQMSSLLAIISKYKSGELSVEAATSVVSVALGISEERAERILYAQDKESDNI